MNLHVSPPLVLACLWAVAAAGVAMLPMRRQMLPGLALLLAAPLLIVWIGARHGWVVAGLGLLAFLSMFRRPLLYLSRRALRLPVERPTRRTWRMTGSLVLACLWALAACLIAMLPSKDRHWRAAYALAALGVPLVGWVTWQMVPGSG